MRWMVLAALFGLIAAGSCAQARGAPLLESSCGNGFDDDTDLMADCADPDCSPNPLCVHDR